MLVTADTNIWISAFNFSGNPRRLLLMAADGKLDLAISDDIIKETRRILGTRFHWPGERLNNAERDMRAVSRHVVPHVELDVVKDDPGDNRILACAVSSGSEYLVTGDKDLLRIVTYDKHSHHEGSGVYGESEGCNSRPMIELTPVTTKAAYDAATAPAGGHRGRSPRPRHSYRRCRLLVHNSCLHPAAPARSNPRQACLWLLPARSASFLGLFSGLTLRVKSFATADGFRALSLADLLKFEVKKPRFSATRRPFAGRERRSVWFRA